MKEDIGNIDDELKRIMEGLEKKSKEPGYREKYERRQEMIRAANVHLLVSHSDIPSKYIESSFDNFVVREDAEGLDHALRACREYVGTWEETKGRGIALFGDIGVGKTHLAVAVANELIRRHLVPVRYANVLHTFEMARWSFDNDGVNPIPMLIKVPFLILDDLGSERPTPWTLEQVAHIIDYRLIHELPVIITSNAMTWQGLFDMLVMEVRGDRESRAHLVTGVERAIDRLRAIVGDPIMMRGTSWRGRRPDR